MALVYDHGSGERRDWIAAEERFDLAYSGKMESLFALANGYMGLRSASEEAYARETRGFYVAGLFDAFPGEVPELANLPDWLGVELAIDGEPFSCLSGALHSHLRSLDLRSGTLLRSIDWESPGGKRVKLRFERFVSMVDLHTAALRITVEPIDFSGTLSIASGIDGQVTNSGVQHLREGDLRLLPGGTIASVTETQQSGIGVCVAAAHRYSADGRQLSVREAVKTGRRRIALEAQIALERGHSFTLTKYVAVHTARDLDAPPGIDGSKLLDSAAASIRRSAGTGYDALTAAHAAAWESLWRSTEVEIDGPGFDRLALRFALFHLLQMAPRSDARTSIAAKGLTGEGYKGHVFWDTEIFMLPLFTFTLPAVARGLLEYRHRTLDGARRKAAAAGYRGAMFAWESTDTGDDTTPAQAAVDIATGRHIPIWSGKIEQHISVDVPYAVWQYYLASGDEAFLLEMGLEIMLETARFWSSRLEWNSAHSRYEITDVMGPDEYGEHVNNNAYTNTMVRWHLRNTAALYERLARERSAELGRIAAKIGLEAREVADWSEKAGRIFTNIDATTGFVLQYDGFGEKRAVDLSRYRGTMGAVTRDYPWSELMRMQVVKQADTVMLLYLLGEDFSAEEKRLNWDYYEPRTLHDSSLSPAIHSIVACDIGELEAAYAYFASAARIDLGPQATGSESGLHAAALGGIWQAAVNGFGGVRIASDGLLHITPRLPERWQGLRFPLMWHGRRLGISITAGLLAVEAAGEEERPFDLVSGGRRYRHPGSGRLEIPLGEPAGCTADDGDRPNGANPGQEGPRLKGARAAPYG